MLASYLADIGMNMDLAANYWGIHVQCKLLYWSISNTLMKTNIPNKSGFVFHSKKLFTNVHYFVHLNLAVALFLGYIAFAAGITTATQYRVSTTAK